VKIRNT